MGREYRCLACGATIGWPGICDGCDAEDKRKAIRKDLTVDEQLSRAGVPSKLIEYRWSGVIVPDGLRLADVRGWDGEPPMLAVVGPRGAGKTGLAACLARDWLLNRKSILWIYIPDWLDELTDLEREGACWQRIKSVCDFRGLLILDEIGAKRPTDFRTEKLLQVLDARERESRPTLVTSNLRPIAKDGVSPSLEQYDERIASRVAAGRVVRWIGPDRRAGI